MIDLERERLVTLRESVAMSNRKGARAAWLEEAESDRERSRRESSDFLAYQDDNGAFADFHANRHRFITNVGRTGIPLTTAQKLARHSDPKLTTNICTHLEVSDQAAAIQLLPPPSQPEDTTLPEAMRATGTDGASADSGVRGGRFLPTRLPRKGRGRAR